MSFFGLVDHHVSSCTDSDSTVKSPTSNIVDQLQKHIWWKQSVMLTLLGLLHLVRAAMLGWRCHWAGQRWTSDERCQCTPHHTCWDGGESPYAGAFSARAHSSETPGPPLAEHQRCPSGATHPATGCWGAPFPPPGLWSDASSLRTPPEPELEQIHWSNMSSQYLTLLHQTEHLWVSTISGNMFRGFSALCLHHVHFEHVLQIIRDVRASTIHVPLANFSVASQSSFYNSKWEKRCMGWQQLYVVNGWTQKLRFHTIFCTWQLELIRKRPHISVQFISVAPTCVFTGLWTETFTI